MAINDLGKLFESESVSDPKAHTLGLAIPAGSLICIALAGKKASGAYLDISSITDSGGNTWDWKTLASSYRMTGVAFSRISAAMGTSDTITINWNGTPDYAWASAHAFSNASAFETEKDSAISSGSTASVNVAVTGSDWLTFASIFVPNEYGMSLTGINSSTSQDDNANSGPSTGWGECFSRNGTTGSSHTIGATLGVSTAWSITAVSFPFEAAPAGGRGQPFLIGV